MRAIDANALRGALDADPSITADVYDLLDAAPTLCCCTCAKWDKDRSGLNSDLHWCQTWDQWTTAAVFCSFWTAPEPKP